jgi:uncharacterized metal-binding protein
MPDGETHFASNVVGGVGLTLLAHSYAPDAVGPVIVGAIIGAFITPDMDIDHTTRNEAILREIPVVGIVFQTAWYPYALLHRHRGISHWPVIGTVGRMVYAVLVVMCLMLFWSGVSWYMGGDPTQFVAVVLDAVVRLANVYLLGAWLAQDMIHLLLDAL